MPEYLLFIMIMSSNIQLLYRKIFYLTFLGQLTTTITLVFSYTIDWKLITLFY